MKMFRKRKPTHPAIAAMHERITEAKNKDSRLWAIVSNRSDRLYKTLHLNPSTVEARRHCDGELLSVDVDGETFVLSMDHVCGTPYGGGWVDMIMATCTSDSSLNETTGDGTIFLTSLIGDWHDKLILELEG